MNGGLALGLPLALASTVAIDAGFVVQQAEAARLRPLSLRDLAGSLQALVGAPRWVVGFVVGLGGWGLYLAALRAAPISLVQSVAAGGIVVVVVLVAVAHRALPSRREVVGAVVATGGLVALGATVFSDTARRVPRPLRTPLIVSSLVAIAIAAVIAGRRRTAGSGGLAAGLLYGLGDVTSKLLVAGRPLDVLNVIESGWLYATVAANVGGFVILQHAFQRGDALASIGSMTAATNLIPIVAGVAILGDPMPSSPWLLAVRITAFAASVTGAWLLCGAGRAEPTRTAPEVEAGDRPMVARRS
jgi:hypothetical protein